MHSSLYTVQAGRGYGRMAVPVMDLGGIGKALHILHRNENRSLCGREAERSILGVDARAIVVKRRPVCVACLDLLGKVPPPWYVREPDVARLLYGGEAA